MIHLFINMGRLLCGCAFVCAGQDSTCINGNSDDVATFVRFSKTSVNNRDVSKVLLKTRYYCCFDLFILVLMLNFTLLSFKLRRQLVSALGVTNFPSGAIKYLVKYMSSI